MTTFRSAVPRVQWPALPTGHGPAMLSLLFQMEQSQWWPAERLRKSQLNQLTSLVDFAAREVPLYRERFAAAGYQSSGALTEAMWASLPLLQRADISDHAADLCGAPLPEHGDCYAKKTSGSSGQPLTVRRTTVSGLIWSALALRDHLWHQRDVEARLLAIRSGRDASDPLAVREFSNWGNPAAEVYATGPSTMFYHLMPIAQQADVLRQRDPAYLLAYPTNVLELADYFRRKDLRLPSLREVRTYGEPVSEEVREICREVWDVPVVDVYSCEEVGYLAMQCPQHAHYHVQAEGVRLEILDADGKLCAPGTVGRVVLTALHEFAMPIIRYEIGDFAEAGAPCPCGRGLPVVQRVLGRRRNLALLPDGRCCLMNLSRAVWQAFENVTRVQLVQRRADVIEIRVAARARINDDECAHLCAAVDAAIGQPFTYTVTQCDEIARHDNGKFESFVCELPWPAQAPRFVA